MKILLNDYAGHAFPIDLAVAMVRRGHLVTYNFCSSNLTPRGDSGEARDVGVDVNPIDLGRQFEKYRVHRRVVDELDYGIRSVLQLRRSQPDASLFGQMPVLSLLLCLAYCRFRGIRAVLWLQDVQSHLAADQSRLAGTVLGFFERMAVRMAPGIVAISDEIATEARSYGGRGEVVVIENWARVTPQVPKSNPWSKGIEADETFNFIYSGTLGAKHRPEALVALAEAFAEDNSVRVIGVCAGAGRDEIEAGGHLVMPELYDLVEPEVLPQVLGAADALVVLLDESAATAVVPSKILSYLVAGRPILGLLPRTNLAARTIEDRAKAGLVAESIDEFVLHARGLVADSEQRAQMASNGRSWAESTFDTDFISGRFEALLSAPSYSADA